MADALAKNPASFSIIYPKTADSTFNMDYYLKNHMPLVQKTWRAHGLKGWKVIQLDPSSGYQAQAILEWESVELMQKALANPDLTTGVMGDIVNYTNVQPLRLLGAQVGSS